MSEPSANILRGNSLLYQKIGLVENPAIRCVTLRNGSSLSIPEAQATLNQIYSSTLDRAYSSSRPSSLATLRLKLKWLSFTGLYSIVSSKFLSLGLKSSRILVKSTRLTHRRLSRFVTASTSQSGQSPNGTGYPNGQY